MEGGSQRQPQALITISWLPLELDGFRYNIGHLNSSPMTNIPRWTACRGREAELRSARYLSETETMTIISRIWPYLCLPILCLLNPFSIPPPHIYRVASPVNMTTEALPKRISLDRDDGIYSNAFHFSKEPREMVVKNTTDWRNSDNKQHDNNRARFIGRVAIGTRALLY